MNKYELIGGADAYNELANAVVVLACDDYREYHKYFMENLDVLKYVNDRIDFIEATNQNRKKE